MQQNRLGLRLGASGWVQRVRPGHCHLIESLVRQQPFASWSHWPIQPSAWSSNRAVSMRWGWLPPLARKVKRLH